MRTHRSPIRLRPGFTILEILMALGLLVIFFGVAGELFKSTMMLGYDSGQLSNQNSRIDSAIFQLRRDVWNSSRMTVSGKKSLDLDSSDGIKISWNIDQENGVTRTDAQGRSERWEGIGENWSLAADGPCLSIRDAAAEICLPSEILLSRGAQP